LSQLRHIKQPPPRRQQGAVFEAKEAEDDKNTVTKGEIYNMATGKKEKREQRE
jgi:hypothetical protein